MKKQLIQFASPVLSKLGLQLLKTKDYRHTKTLNSILLALTKERQASTTRGSDPGTTFIIFSKDRTLQLDGLLRSLLCNVAGAFKLRVLFRASSTTHANAYKEIQEEFSNQTPIVWISEKNFKQDLVNELQQVTTESVCFLVDDIVFIRKTNLNTLNSIKPASNILSLRLGSNITYCYTKQKSMVPPKLKADPNHSDLYQFSWKQSTLDWAYPMSLDGHFFPTDLIRIAAQELDYNAPNTLERGMQLLTPLFIDQEGYCYSQPKLFNIPMNRVQNENGNISANIDPNDLLQKWNHGYRLEFEALADITTSSPHEETHIHLTKRLQA
ncbi:MAG TPA: hypothetical protein DCX06_00385 [Opitutae bacterium]|nr:hypothetical protein [Opitutae bacterium]